MFSKKERQEIHHKLKILNDAKQYNNVTLTGFVAQIEIIVLLWGYKSL